METMNMDNLKGTRFEGIRHGSDRWKRLSGTDKKNYEVLVGTGIAIERLPVTEADVEKARRERNSKLAENLLQELPNEQTLDDTGPNDMTPEEAQRLGQPYSRVRSFKDYKIGRDHRYGLWTVVGLAEIGRFTSLQEAEKGLAAYLEKQQAQSQDDRGTFSSAKEEQRA